jgi:hypothetical protein
MRRGSLIIILLLCTIVGFAQQEAEYYKKDFFRYENQVYKPNIRTVQLAMSSWEFTSPIIKLNSDEKLKLDFDDMDGDIKQFSYTVIHCDMDWKPSDISPSEYIDGYQDELISDYRSSFNTVPHYTHYRLVFPTEVMKITRSGIYLLNVFKTGSPEEVILTRRFMVFETKVEVEARVHQATIISDRNYKQEIDFTINHPGYEISNPYDDIRVVLMQNDRFDNCITKLKPLFTKQDQLVYDYDEDNVFNAGNEFRYFNCKSLRLKTENINYFAYDSLKRMNVYLLNDESRSYKRYITRTDINGRYTPLTDMGSNPETDADYVKVHFFLPYELQAKDGNFYVFGGLSDWECQPRFKMQYDPLFRGYVLTAELKQGVYNYEYVFQKDGSKVADETLVEGNHSETENDYLILVYHRTIGVFYDQLIACKRANSNLTDR